MKYNVRRFAAAASSFTCSGDEEYLPPPPPKRRLLLGSKKTASAPTSVAEAEVLLLEGIELAMMQSHDKFGAAAAAARHQQQQPPPPPQSAAAEAAAAAAAEVEAAEAAVNLARAQFNEAHRAAAAANAAVSAAAQTARAAAAAVFEAQLRRNEALEAVNREARLQSRHVPQPKPHKVHSRTIGADDRAAILAHVRSCFVQPQQMSAGCWEKRVALQASKLLAAFSVAPIMPEAVNRYFAALAAAHRAAARKEREQPHLDRAADARERNAQHAVEMQALRATLILVVVQRCPALLLSSVAELVTEFPEACEDTEVARLLHFRNLLRCGVWLFGGRNNKGMLLALAGRLSGRMYVTGGGSTSDTRRRERLLIQLSGVVPRSTSEDDDTIPRCLVPPKARRLTIAAVLAAPHPASHSPSHSPSPSPSASHAPSDFVRMHAEGELDIAVAAAAADFFAPSNDEDKGCAAAAAENSMWSELSSSAGDDVVVPAPPQDDAFAEDAEDANDDGAVDDAADADADADADAANNAAAELHQLLMEFCDDDDEI